MPLSLLEIMIMVSLAIVGILFGYACGYTDWLEKNEYILKGK